MALLPDPTTAASERSSVKNRLTGSRRRGSGRKTGTGPEQSAQQVEEGPGACEPRGFRGKDVHNMKARSQDL